MYRQKPSLVRAADREAHYSRQRHLFESLIDSVQECLSPIRSLEAHRQADRLHVARTSSSSPLLSISFDEGTADIAYATNPAEGETKTGTVLAGYSGAELLRDRFGVAHRMQVREVTASLLAAALSVNTAFGQVA